MPMKVPCQVAFAVLFSLGASWSAVAQQDGASGNFVRRYLERILGESGDPAAPKFINYPTVAFAPETSSEFGV